jgi:hypothetical protein
MADTRGNKGVCGRARSYRREDPIGVEVAQSSQQQPVGFGTRGARNSGLAGIVALPFGWYQQTNRLRLLMKSPHEP